MATKKQESANDMPEAAADISSSAAEDLASTRAWDDYRRSRADEMRADYMRDSGRLSQDLSEPFPRELERILRKGGTDLTYIPISEVIVRLNKVFGVMGWSSEIIKCERDALDPDFIVAHVRLTVITNGSDLYSLYSPQIQKDGFGGQKIKRTKQGEIVDLGDEFKGAVSDALKKAAQQLGVGLYLSRTEEALMLEEEQEHAAAHAAAVAAIDPKIKALWDQFTSLSKDLKADEKVKLGEFWNSYSGGKPKPTLETATPQIITALIEECTKILFPGSEYAAPNVGG